MILEEVPLDYCTPYKSYRIPKRNLCPQLLPAIVQVRPGTTVTGAVRKRYGKRYTTSKLYLDAKYSTLEIGLQKYWFFTQLPSLASPDVIDHLSTRQGHFSFISISRTAAAAPTYIITNVYIALTLILWSSMWTWT